MTDTRDNGFDSELCITAQSATTWKLLAPLIWTGSKGDTFCVPVGFTTDFATVPRFLHWLILPYGAYTRAAVLHDWLLVSLAAWQERHDDPVVRAPIDGSDDEPPANSRDTDGIFRRVMQELGVPWAKRWTMWAAVRTAALFNHRRAYGRQFERDVFKVAVVAVAAVPFVLPGALGVSISLALTRLVTWSRKRA
jgi:hypothetical protein